MSQIETTTAVAVLTLIKKPASSADYKNNAEFYHAAALKATETYNVALQQYHRAVELESAGPGTSVTFNEGKGEKAEILTGQVLATLEDGRLQVLVQYVGAPAKLLNVKTTDLIAVNHQQPAQAAEEVVEQPAATPEFDAAQ